MGKNRRILVAVLLPFVIGAFAYEVIRPHEPEFQGRRLTSWLAYDMAHLSSLDSMATEAEQDQVRNAVRHIGADAIPVLMKLIQAKDGLFKQQLVQFTQRYPFIPIHPRSAGECHGMAMLGFKLLGPLAEPAVPALTKLLDDCEGDGAILASLALARIGPCAKESVPTLVRNLHDQNALVRSMATNALRQISHEAAWNKAVDRV